MPFTVMLSPDAKEYLDSLDDKRASNIRKHLKELEIDPFKPRAACDIDIVAGSVRAGGLCYGSLPKEEGFGLSAKLITKRGYKIYQWQLLKFKKRMYWRLMQMGSIENSREKRTSTYLLMSIALNVASSELLELQMTSSYPSSL
jgi:hypothetical protein